MQLVAFISTKNREKGGYNANHETIASLNNSLVSDPLYVLVTDFFNPNFSVLDVGCGIGRGTETG
jgi:hypothetical protein